ncbi:MAG: NUDIX hydrolase [Acidobacteria bacterium]|jgi:ADP-ribose pyrophosphatase|nr:NUDIX hydrolase [Acidobacteriota bacterium]
MTKPEVISTETIYEGKIFDVFLTEIREGESEYNREIVAHHGSAVIVPVFADKTVALVKQYRHAAQKYLLEIPAGTLEKDENPEMGARRELEEEIGITAENIEKLTEFYVSPGFLTEKMHVFLATNLTETKQSLEEDELIEIEKITFEQAFEKIKNSEIQDAKTIVGLILAGAKFGFSIIS